MSDDKLKIALVGCGRISKNHFDAISASKDELELIAVCDTEPKVMSEHAERLLVPGFSSVDNLLSAVAPDIVAICTPSGTHPELAIRAAAKGCHVISEKPMATTWESGKQMVAACERAGVQLFVVKQNRLNPTVRLLKRAIEEGRFGRIRMVQANVFWTRPQTYYDQGGWRGKWVSDGGALMNQASHYVDLLDWLAGPIEQVHAMVSTLRRIETEDTAALNLRWRNGAIGSMSVTMLTYPKNLEGSITILGDKGSARLGGLALNQIQVWDFSDTCSYDADVQNTNYSADSVYGFGHNGYYRNVVDTLRGRTAAATDGRSGLRSLEVLIAAYRSARDGVTVGLPLDL